MAAWEVLAAAPGDLAAAVAGADLGLDPGLGLDLDLGGPGPEDTTTSIVVDVVSSPSDAVIFPVRSPLHSVVPCPVLSVRTVVEVSWPVDVVNVTVASRTPPPPDDSTST